MYLWSSFLPPSCLESCCVRAVCFLGPTVARTGGWRGLGEIRLKLFSPPGDMLQAAVEALYVVVSLLLKLEAQGSGIC